MLVDTLYDLHLTREMLDSMAPLLERHPIDAALNTHSNPDHCFGNELLPEATEICASAVSAAEMQEVSPQRLQGLKTAPGLSAEMVAFVDRAFSPFDFEGITVRTPTQTFAGRLDLQIGHRGVSFVELGPAHTGGDTIVHVPDADAVFTGDLLFIEGTPIVWASLSNWIAACDRIIELGASVLVPGHGPVTDESGVRDVRRYLQFIQRESRLRFDAVMDPVAAADDIDISDFADWGDPERVAANVVAAYRELGPSLPHRRRSSCSSRWPDGRPGTDGPPPDPSGVAALRQLASRRRPATVIGRRRAISRPDGRAVGCGCATRCIGERQLADADHRASSGPQARRVAALAAS